MGYAISFWTPGGYRYRTGYQLHRLALEAGRDDLAQRIAGLRRIRYSGEDFDVLSGVWHALGSP